MGHSDTAGFRGGIASSIEPNVSQRNIQHEPIAHHIATAIDEAPLREDPYCHFYVENILPEPVFQELLSRLPNPKMYTALNPERWSRPDGTSIRDRFSLAPENLDTLSEEDQQFWSTFSNALASKQVKDAVFRKLAPDLVRRFKVGRDAVTEITSYSHLWLYREIKGYKIEPHPDSREKIVTMMFYLPEDLSQEDLGTSVYEEQSLWKRLTGSRFKETYRFPFRPNSLMAFAVINQPGRKSWHGRELIETECGVRNSILKIYKATETAR